MAEGNRRFASSHDQPEGRAGHIEERNKIEGHKTTFSRPKWP